MPTSPLCDTPAGTFERAWLVSPLIDLEYSIRDVMAEYSVTDEQLEVETVIDTPRAVLEWPYLRFVEDHPARPDHVNQPQEKENDHKN